MSLKILLKILGILIYSIAFGELFVRLFSPVAIVPRYVSETDYGIRGNDPDRSYWHVGPEYKVEVRTNSQGIRSDKEFSFEKPDDTFRIIILGDSFGMGYEVSLEDSFATKLENYFTKETGLKCETINLSTSGHGTAEELIVLKEKGLKYDPDLVLLCWHRTDYDDNVRSNLYTIKEGTLKRNSATYLPGIDLRKKLFAIPGYTLIAENSQLYNSAREKAANHVKSILASIRGMQQTTVPSQNVAKTEKQDPENRNNQWANQYEEELALALIDEVRKTASQANAAFLILDIPQRLSRSSFTSTIPEQIKEKDSLYSVYSPIHDFAPYKGQKLYWEQGHYHFTPLACDIVGKGLAENAITLLHVSTKQEGGDASK